MNQQINTWYFFSWFKWPCWINVPFVPFIKSPTAQLFPKRISSMINYDMIIVKPSCGRLIMEIMFNKTRFHLLMKGCFKIIFSVFQVKNHTVSWIRNRDSAILSIDGDTIIHDRRISVIKARTRGDYVLSIKYVIVKIIFFCY